MVETLKFSEGKMAEINDSKPAEVKAEAKPEPKPVHQHAEVRGMQRIMTPNPKQ